MKPPYCFLLLTIILFSSSIAKAQTDSTEIKLNQYKDWYEKGLINDQEYNELKKKTLDLSNAPSTTTDKSPKKTSTSYKGKLIGGSVFLATGTSFVAGGLYLKRHPRLVYKPNIKGYAYDYKKARRGGNGVIVMGSLQMALGAFLLGKGIHGLVIHQNRQTKASIGITPSGQLGLVCIW